MKGTYKAYRRRNTELKRLGYSSYEEYLRSELWKTIRDRVFKKRGRHCTLCPSPADVVHHQTYSKRVLTGHKICDLLPMCRRCHSSVEYDDTGRKREIDAVHNAVQKLRAAYRKQRAV